MTIVKKFNSPVIIIAAARSGTKMLREVISQSSSIVEFPYDMNYIWLYSNYDKNHDELNKCDLTNEIKYFIRDKFESLLKKSNATRVLEKSVPNSLRVEFVKEVFPDAQLIHLFRNGLDVSVDAKQCWETSLFSKRIQKKSDLLKKIIDFPYVNAWPYLKNYLIIYLKKQFTRDSSLRSWGPRYKNIDNDVKQYTLLELCGIQWAKSIECCLNQLSVMHENVDFINVKYEDLVTHSEKEVQRICRYIDIPDADKVIEYGKQNISSEFIDYHKSILTHEDINKLKPHIESSLKSLGYQGF